MRSRLRMIGFLVFAVMFFLFSNEMGKTLPTPAERFSLSWFINVGTQFPTLFCTIVAAMDQSVAMRKRSLVRAARDILSEASGTNPSA